MSFLLEKARFKKLKIGHSLAAVVTLLALVLILAMLFSVFVPLVVEQARNLSEVDYKTLGEALREPISDISHQLYDWGIINDVKEPEEQISNLLKGWFEPAQLGNLFSSVLGFAGNIFITFFSVLFIAFFFLKEQRLFSNFIKAVVPRKNEDGAINALGQIRNLLSRYFGAILTQMTIITVYISLALTIFGIENALLIGFFAALLNVVPYVGPFLGAAFGVFVTISSNIELEFYSQMLPMLTTVVAIFATMQLMDNFLLQPFIFSTSVKAHPLEIFLIILAGAQIGGILGMILAIPTYTVLRVVAKVFLSEFKVVQKITGSM